MFSKNGNDNQKAALIRDLLLYNEIHKDLNVNEIIVELCVN